MITPDGIVLFKGNDDLTFGASHNRHDELKNAGTNRLMYATMLFMKSKAQIC